MLHRNIKNSICFEPAIMPDGDHEMRMFVIAASALLAIATQALVVGTVVTNI